MKIIESRKKTTILYCIMTGEMFKYNGQYYMRIDPINDNICAKEGCILVLNLNTSTIYDNMSSELTVTRVEGELHIKEE